MRKIPTLFVRDSDDRRYVTPEVTPGCEWVLAGEGTPTRKFDGTCVMLDGTGRWWARREVKPGNEAPPNYLRIEHDEETGKTVGWEPAEQSGFAKYHAEAIRSDEFAFAPGTYELIGPKINGNPERWAAHALIQHGIVPLTNPDPITFETLRDALTGDFTHEGIVWHHPDGRMAKLKRRDFAGVADAED